MADTTSKDLFNKLRGKFSNLTLGREDGQQTLVPQEAVFFEFDYTNQGQKLGSVVVSLVDEGALKVYFNNDIVTEQDADATQGFYDFLTGLKHFATANMLNYEAKNISKSRLDKKDYQYLANQNKTEDELAMESRLYGSKQKSYQDLNGAKLIVQHSHTVDEERHGARSRNIKAIYIENSDGERYKFENNYLPGARAMARHVSNGGYPRDEHGQHISEIMAEMSELKNFVRGVKRNNYVNEDAQEIIEKATGRYYGLKSTLESISRQRGYADYFENFVPDAVEVSDDDINDIKSKLTRSVFDDTLESSLSAVGKAMKLNEKKSGDFYDWDDWSRAAKKNGAEIKGDINHAVAVVDGREIGEWNQDEQDRTGDKIASRFKKPGYGELNMGDADLADTAERDFQVPDELKLIPGEMPQVKARDGKAVLQMALVDIASRAVDDEVSVFAADMAEKIGSQGGPFGQQDTPEFKEQKKKAIQLAKMYLAQHQNVSEAGTGDAPINKMSREDLIDYLNISASEAEDMSTEELRDAAEEKTADMSESGDKYFSAYEDSMSEIIGEKKKVDHDGDGDNDFDDVMIARMVASGMDKDKAIAKVKSKKEEVDEGKMSDIDSHVEEMIADGATDEEIMAMHPGIVTQEYLDQKRADSDEKYYDDMEETVVEGTDDLDWIKRMSGIGSSARSNHGLREGEPGYQIKPRSVVAREMQKLKDIENN